MRDPRDVRDPRDRDGRDRDDRSRDVRDPRDPRDQASHPAAHPAQPAADLAGGHASPAPTAEARVHTGGPLDKGASVRVLRGPFEGKIGTIGDLDGKGGARVLLGLLSTRLELSDLEPVSEAQGRPSPAASLRKPQSADPRKAR